MAVVWPGLVNWITPAQVHISFELLSSAGMFAIMTVGAPGTHGAGVTGMQGAGVGTPSAAAVAAITIGLVGALHIPNGGMLTMGAKAVMLADGVVVKTMGDGRTTKVLGAAPKLHCIIAPIQT